MPNQKPLYSVCEVYARIRARRDGRAQHLCAELRQAVYAAAAAGRTVAIEAPTGARLFALPANVTESFSRRRNRYRYAIVCAAAAIGGSKAAHATRMPDEVLA